MWWMLCIVICQTLLNSTSRLRQLEPTIHLAFALGLVPIPLNGETAIVPGHYQVSARDRRGPQNQ